MYRMSKRIISLLVVISFLLSMVLVAQASTSGIGTLVTDVSSLNAGDQIIIVAMDYDYALSTTQNTNNRGQAAVTKSGSTVSCGTDVQVITLETGTVSGTFGFNVGDAGYLYAASSSGNYLKSTTTLSDNASWKISIDASTGAATITASGTYTRNTMFYNSTSALFSCYASDNATQKAVCIYKLGGSTDTGDSGSSDVTTGSGAATLVTDVSSLSAGDQIIIVAMDYDYALSTTQNTNNRGQAAVTKSGSTVSYGTDVQVITLETGTVSGTFGFNVGNAGYLYAASSSGNYLKSTTTLSDNASWKITIDASTGAATITASGTYTNNTMFYNSTSRLFSCYVSTNTTQKAVCIYKLGASSGSGGSGSAVTPSGNTGVLVKDVSTLGAGDKIIIVSAVADQALSTEQKTSNRGQVAITRNSDGTVTYTTDTQIIQLETGTVSGTFAFYVGTVGYLYASSSSSNQLKSTTTLSDNASWAITIDASTGVATATASGTNSRNYLRHNPSSGLFSCYDASSTLAGLMIYQVSDDAEVNSGSSDTDSSSCNHDWSNGYCTKCATAYVPIVTDPTGYTSASDVEYNITDGVIANWGARGEQIDFLSTYATAYYTGDYSFDILSALSGGTSTTDAPNSALYAALQDMMVTEHTTFTTYSNASNDLDCRYYYQYMDCLKGDTTYVSTIYRGELVGGIWDGGVSYNQEHIWPHSKCIGDETTDVGDLMHLRAAIPNENSSRNNTAYGESDGYYDPGLSVRGDCARTVLYLYTRWGNTGYMWGTDGVIESLDILLKWIREDPVDTWEMGHNDAVESVTGVRNVFVDYPEYAWLLFGEEVPATLETPSSGAVESGDVDYYLFGYINGANYACEEDYANLGEYKFVDGKLTATFASDSYVAVKTGDNANWYMTQTYVTDTTATFYNTSTGAAEKMLVPGGVEVTFTLVENSDGSLTLSYVTASTECAHSYTSSITTAATCTTAGVWTYTCSKCADSYTATIAATGHSYTDGTCAVCGAADPDYSAVVQPTLTLKYPSLSFEAEILYNVYYIAENTDDVVEMGLLTFDSEVADGSIDNATDVIPGFETDGTIWKVGTNGISAKNLGDDLYFMVYAEMTDGSYVYSAMKSYSAVSYANTILGRSTSTDYMKALVVSMLNYGTEAQLYFGHNTDSLMNAGLTAEQQALVGAYDESMMDSVVAVDSTKAQNFVYDGSSFARRAPSVSFDGAFSINYYFTAANAPDDGMTLYYWNIDDYLAADVLTVDNATGSMEMVATETENQFWGNVTGIAAKELDYTVFVVGVYEHNGTTYSTGVLNYSIGKYCEGIAAKDTSDQQTFAQATAVYGYCAKEYFANL